MRQDAGNFDKFEMGLRFVVARVLHEYVASRQIEEGARVRMSLEPVSIEEEDWDVNKLDATYKFLQSLNITVEL